MTTSEYDRSTNKQKHQSKNPLMALAIGHFHARTRAMLPPDARRVLEVGCGEGFSSAAIIGGQDGIAFYGGDLFYDAVHEARARVPSMHPCVFDATALPYDDNTFDCVMSLEVLEHLPDPAAALAEYRRVTRRYLLLSVPNEPVFRIQRLLTGKGWSMWGDHPEHIQHWSIWGFTRFVRAQNVRVIRKASPFPYAWSILLCEK